MMLATDVDTLQTCVLQYRGRFQASARRVLRDPEAAQDAVQDAMVSALRNLPRFRGDSQMSTWMGRIVINQAISRRRVIARRPESSLDTLVEGRGASGREDVLVARTEPGPERRLLQDEARRLIRAAIDDLPSSYRTVVVMRHFEGVPIAEIAGRLGVTPNAAKLRLIRARRMLRRLLADRGYDAPAGRL
jgi:RNA polymerase sigma-70 factor, ECF subfamily